MLTFKFLLFAVHTACILVNATKKNTLIRSRRGGYVHSYGYASSLGSMPSASTGRSGITSICCLPAPDGSPRYVGIQGQMEVQNTEPCETVCKSDAGTRTFVVKSIIPRVSHYEPPLSVHSERQFSSSSSDSSRTSFSSGPSYSYGYKYSHGSVSTVSSEGGGTRSITIQIPFPAVDLGSHFIASKGTVHEIPVPEEFGGYETTTDYNYPRKIAENVPEQYGPPAPTSRSGSIIYSTLPKQASISSISYGRSSFPVATITGSDETYTAGTTRKPSSGYGRPSYVEVPLFGSNERYTPTTARKTSSGYGKSLYPEVPPSGSSEGHATSTTRKPSSGYGRPSYAEVPLSGSSGKYTTRKPRHHRPDDMEVEGEPIDGLNAAGVDKDLSSETEVKASEQVNEIPNDRKRKARQ